VKRPDAETSPVEASLLETVAAQRGHFVYESGHHGDLWLDLDALWVNTGRARGWAAALARRTAACQPQVVCGPLTGGALVAQSMAAELDAGFVFAERQPRLTSPGQAVRYHIPGSLRERLQGKRVLLVDDAINAGSAVLATLADLIDCGARLAGLAALITLGETAPQIAERHKVPFYTLVSLERQMWEPERCPYCRSGMPLIDRLAS
jgi:orotate phosphoribosyltransferase